MRWITQYFRRRAAERYHDASLPHDFDEETYLRLNPDVAKDNSNAREHYINFGRKEGRLYKGADVETLSLPDDFNPVTYLDLNPDLAAAGVEASVHYFVFGQKEGRPYKHSDDPVASRNKLKSRIAAMKVDLTTVKEIQSEIYSTVVSQNDRTALPNPKVVAFYLPQYHQIKENDEWWGEGFTEWTNVKKAKPNFVGHNQPHVPENGRYYDLSNLDVQKEQARIATQYGISAFCYYMYWFNGRRVLEKPLDLRLNDRSINMDFCICWANENWTRTWDGKANDILLEQRHTNESDRDFIKDAMKYLAHPNYLRIDGKLVLLVYRVDLMVDSPKTVDIWRSEVRAAGLGELYLCAVQFYGIDDPRDWGFDAAVEFPPHGWLVQENLPDYKIEITNSEFKGTIFDYKKTVDFALKKPLPDYNWHRGAFPSWDNTARRQHTPHIFANSSPDEFQRWMLGILRQQVIMSKSASQMVFVNAWNEWGEGAHLEPDARDGHSYLQSVQSALNDLQQEKEAVALLSRLREAGDYPGRQHDEQRLLNLLRSYEQAICALLTKA